MGEACRQAAFWLQETSDYYYAVALEHEWAVQFDIAEALKVWSRWFGYLADAVRQSCP